jgi:hypothetical protein
MKLRFVKTERRSGRCERYLRRRQPQKGCEPYHQIGPAALYTLCYQHSGTLSIVHDTLVRILLHSGVGIYACPIGATHHRRLLVTVLFFDE